MTEKNKYLLIIILTSLILLASIWYLLSLLNKQPANLVNKIIGKEPVVYTHSSQLDGTGVASAAEKKPQVIAVMIDNHPDAWPVSGLFLARVVYEAPAEGGITRYLAIFNASTSVDEVGPVRSARPYYLDWIKEYGEAPYMHSGGSPAALKEIKNSSDIFDVNEFWWGQYYWRSGERAAPHNLYTNNVRWQELLQSEGSKHPTKNWEGWKFATATLSSRPFGHELKAEWAESRDTVKSIKIPYGPDYLVEWKYNTQTQKYGRYINGEKMLDRHGQEITADNVLIQLTGMKILDEEGRREIDTVGTGEGRVLTLGHLARGVWKKNKLIDRTRWFDEAGKEAILLPGVTWVQIAPSDIKLEIGS